MWRASDATVAATVVTTVPVVLAVLHLASADTRDVSEGASCRREERILSQTLPTTSGGAGSIPSSLRRFLSGAVLRLVSGDVDTSTPRAIPTSLRGILA